MRKLLAISKGKVVLTVGVFFFLLIIALVSYRGFNNVALAGWLFFPLRLYQWFYPLLRKPGYDDNMYGDQQFPGSDLVAFFATIVVSVLLVYILVCLGVSMVQPSNRSRQVE
jgi:small basic protein